MMARRVLVLAYLLLAVAPLQSVSGQEGGVAEAEKIDLDEVLDTLADAEVAERGEEEGDSSTPAEVAGDTDEGELAEGDEDEDEDVPDVFEETEDAAEDAAAAAVDEVKSESAGGSGSGSGGFFKPGLFKKRAKTGNSLCSWSWKKQRCEPVDLCQYKYQFLDATIGESCRLADQKLTRKVFESPDVQVKPAVALTGAAGLFAADLVAIRYTNWLERFPLLFNVVQGFVLLLSGDTLFQVLEQGWQKVVGLKFWRMIRSGAIGALNNGLVHYSYYKWIDGRFPYDKFSEKTFGPKDGAKSKLAVGFTKWAIEWPTIGVYKIVSMYILTAVLSGDMKGLGARLQDSFFLTWLRSLQVWPIYDMILYAYVPTAHRPLFNSFMSIAWGGYLSHVPSDRAPYPAMHTRRQVQENAGFGMDENAKPSDIGVSGATAGKAAGLGGVAKKGLGGVQTRRGLRDITNNKESVAEGAGKGGKKPGARVASASVGSADTGTAAPAAPGNSSAPAVALSSSATMTAAAPAPPAAVASESATTTASRPIRTATRKPTDIDERDADEPLAVTEYVEDLYMFLREREVATKVDRRYMEAQPNVNERMRSILIDWLVEVHLKFKLVPDTLYLTVYLIDKYLEVEKVTRQNLQLVGVTAMLLASKYEEIYPPQIRDLVFITDRAYNRDQILEMESTMANALEFRLTVPTIYCFLLRYLKAAHADKKIVQLSCYVAERMLQEVTMLDYLPSVVACCAIYVARKNMGRTCWSPTLEKYTKYQVEQLMPCLTEISRVLNQEGGDLEAVKKKFSSSKFGSVASMKVNVLPDDSP
eukprot:g17851.t1